MPGRLALFLLLAAILEAKHPGPAEIAGAHKEFELRTLEEAAKEGEEGASETAVGEGAEGEEGAEAAEGEEGEGEEGEEEEEPSEADSEVAYMLLGAVIFVVSMFYLVNWDDDDIRYYSMNIISMTMSIFSAVLMYQGINEQITRFTHGWSELHRVVVQFVHCAVYIVIMQLLIGFFSGVTLPPWEKNIVDFDAEKWLVADGLRSDFNQSLSDSEVAHVRNKLANRSVWIDEFGVEVPVSKEKHNLMVAQRRMRCWAMLLAHMSGFAAINAGAHLQAVKVFNSSPLTAILPALINQLVLQIFFKIASVARARGMKECIEKGGESGHKKVLLCHEAVIEAENDVSSLSLSFLTVQVVRFIISGVMPNAEGEEEPPVVHAWSQIFLLFGLGLVAVVLAIVSAMYCGTGEEEEEDDVGPGGRHHVPETSIRSRAGGILSNTLAMIFAWILLFGSKWLLLKMALMNVEAMIGQIVHALGLSILCGVAVFTLDFIDDTMRSRGGGQQAQMAIRVIIQAIAILIGFSWEHCFDAGVADVAYVTPHKRSSKFLLGCFVCFFLVPAWRKHILTKVLAYEDMKKKRAHAKKTGVRRSLILRKQQSQYQSVSREENGVAEVQTVTSSDMETGKVPKEAFLSSVKEGDKVNLVSLQTTDFVFAELNGKCGLLPKKWLAMAGASTKIS